MTARATWRVVIAMGAIASMTASLLGPLPATAAEPTLGYSASAFGSTAFRPGRIVVGRSSVSVIGCTTNAGAHDDNTVASIQAPPLFRTGAVNTTADAMLIPGGKASKATAQTKNFSALDGLISADVVKAVSTTSYQSGFATSGAGSAFVDLRIAGQSRSETPAPNTRVNLPGLGYVVLNEQRRQVSPTSASLIVNMIHVYITQENPQNIPRGTQIIISHAESGLRFRKGLLDGFAYGTRVAIGSNVLSGPTARIYMPCEGTNGAIRTNSLTQVLGSPAVVTGTLLSTVQGTVNSTIAQGETTSTAQSVNVAQGLVKADLVKAATQSSTDGNTFAFDDAGSMFTNLQVQGFPSIDEDPPPNTRIEIPNVGVLWLHRIIRTPNAIEVRMIELILGEGNPPGLPIGTSIRVSVSHASAHR